MVIVYLRSCDHGIYTSPVWMTRSPVSFACLNVERSRFCRSSIKFSANGSLIVLFCIESIIVVGGSV